MKVLCRLYVTCVYLVWCSFLCGMWLIRLFLLLLLLSTVESHSECMCSCFVLALCFMMSCMVCLCFAVCVERRVVVYIVSTTVLFAGGGLIAVSVSCVLFWRRCCL